MVHIACAGDVCAVMSENECSSRLGKGCSVIQLRKEIQR